MVDAGVSLSDPANLNNFTFTVTVKLEQTPIPQTITYIGSTSEDAPQGELTATWSGGGGGGGDIGTGGIVLSPEIIPQAKQIVADEPIIAIISTTQTVSWLKEMYNVNLSILNAADTSYVIKDSTAELYLPDGVSLAVTKDGQSPVIDMGSIAGQQQKNASWVVKGDKTGTYQLEADFRGTLMPFNRTVNAHFETKKDFSVSTGEGLHIIISPEEAAYIDENYYIQFEIRNESDRSFYNFTTTLGAYQYEESRNEVIVHDEINGEDSYPEKQQPTVYTLPSGCTQMPVLQGGDQINIPVLAPGESIYGTYHETFDAEGDPYEVYYRLIETLVTTVKNDVTGVKISIQPIQSHLSRSIVTYRERKNYFADPVDLATGAFTDSIPVISVTGASELSFSIDYNSMLAGMQGENGNGFYHNLETRLVDGGNSVAVYMTSGIKACFIPEQAMSGTYYGTVYDNQIYLAETIEEQEVHYTSISSGMEQYSLTKYTDGTYALITPAGDTYLYDANGRNILITDDNGREIEIQYDTENRIKTITEPVSGQHLYIHYGKNGMIEKVTDDSGRSATFAYTDGNLTAYTNVLGETTTFTYDKSNRILTETDCEGITYVTNTYDEATGRGRKSQTSLTE